MTKPESKITAATTTHHTNSEILDVKAIRKRLGLSQRKLALLLGKTIYTVRMWENGAREPERDMRALLIDMVVKTIQRDLAASWMSPSSDQDIRDYARAIIGSHGDQSGTYAAAMARWMRANRNTRGATVWFRIGEAVEAMQQQDPGTKQAC